MTALYELAEQYRTLLDFSEEDEEGFTKQLESLKDAIGDKVENIGLLVLNIRGENVGIEQEIERLSKRLKSNENKEEHLLNYTLNEMDLAKIPQVKKQNVTITIRINPPSVVVENEEDIVEEFIRIVPEQRLPDKKKVIEHFKETGEIPSGFNVITDRKRVDVK